MSVVAEQYDEHVRSKLQGDAATYFLELVAETHEIETRWIIFCLLFRSSKDKVKLLNKYMGGVSACMQDALYVAIVMRISCLRDSKKRFSLNLIKDYLKGTRFCSNEEVMLLLDEAIDACTEASEEIRNNHLAHHNKAIYTSDSKDFFYPESKKIDRVIKSLHHFMDAYAKANDMLTFGTDAASAYSHTVEEFIFRLKGEEPSRDQLMSTTLDDMTQLYDWFLDRHKE